jgi:type IV secretion system protein VirB10
MKVITLSILMLTLALSGFAQTPAGPVGPAAQPQPAAEPQPAPPVEPAVPAPSAPAVPADSPVAIANGKIVVPADTKIPLILNNTINTKSAYVGEAVYCESVYPITVGNHIIIPKGSSIRGTVTQVIRPGRVKGRAQVGLRFDELILPNGTTRHLRATLSGFGSEGDDRFKPQEGKLEGGGSKGKDAETIERTTLPGAEIGTIVGATKGAPLEGLGIGSAIGAATGVILVLATRGKDIVLPYGTSLELQLLQPVNFDREEVDPPSNYEQGPAIPRREYGSH